MQGNLADNDNEWNQDEKTCSLDDVMEKTHPEVNVNFKKII